MAKVINHSEDNILHIPKLDECEPPAGGLGLLFFQKMTEFSNNIAQIEAETGKSETYGELLLRSIRVAQNLQQKGITSADLIVLCSFNHTDCFVPLCASLFLGVKIASLDPTLDPHDVLNLLNMVKPRMIFSGTESVQLIESSLEEIELKSDIIVYGQTNTHTPFTELLRATGIEEQFKPKFIDDLSETAFIFFSSGTSGMPKGMCTTHYGILSQQLTLGKYIDASVIFYYTTFYWISALMMLTASLLKGGRRVVSKPFDQHTVMKYIQNYKVTSMFLAPIYTHKIIDQYKSSDDYDTSSLKEVLIGGSAVSETNMLKLRKLFPHTAIQCAYGMTEVSGMLASFHPIKEKELLDKYPTSCGRLMPGFIGKVVDPETNKILKTNEKGEIRVKSKSLLHEYYKNPVETKKAFDEDGFLYTGDLGYYNEDYCFFLIERIKEVIKYQSWHIIPSELEHILLTHPDVQEAVVIGKPHEIDGELPTGFVVLKPGAQIKEEELIAYYDQSISGYDRKKMRGGFIFMDSIPKTPTGKPRRNVLRSLLQN